MKRLALLLALICAPMLIGTVYAQVPEQLDKLQRADNRDVHDDSKATTLPIAREIVETYVAQPAKAPWYVDLLNITLGVRDVATARERIACYVAAFAADGSRITENLDFA